MDLKSATNRAHRLFSAHTLPDFIPIPIGKRKCPIDDSDVGVESLLADDTESTLSPPPLPPSIVTDSSCLASDLKVALQEIEFLMNTIRMVCQCAYIS